MQSIFMRYPSGKAKAVTFSYDDGVPQDKTLAAIFDKYGLKGTFNFNGEGFRSSFSKEEVEEYFLSKGHEIAIHGEFHRTTGYLRPIEGIKEVLNCRAELEKKCGRIIRGMAYPNSGICRFGGLIDYNGVKNYLSELDIAYSRTLGGDNNAFELPNDFHAWMPTAHHDNPKIMEYIDEFLAIDTSNAAYCSTRYPRLLYIWGHSYEFERNNNWEHIEKICEKLSKNDEIWYATNIEICDYCEAYKSLIYSTDNKIIYNPTATDVWIDVDGAIYEIKSGETVNI